MTGRAVCPDCERERQATMAGTFPLHRRGGATCPGAGGRPADAVMPPAPRSKPSDLPPPAEPAGGRSCDAGACNRPSLGWRRFRTHPDEWLPVCGIHMDGPAGRNRIYDPTGGL